MSADGHAEECVAADQLRDYVIPDVTHLRGSLGLGVGEPDRPVALLHRAAAQREIDRLGQRAGRLQAGVAQPEFRGGALRRVHIVKAG